jgi:hypothetical protein
MGKVRQNPYLVALFSAIVVLVLFRLGSRDVLLAAINAAIASALFFHLSLHVLPTPLLLTTTGVLAVMLYADHFKWLTDLFAASIFLGLYYNRLARRLPREDDFLYVPLFYGLFFFSILLVFSSLIHHLNPIVEMRGFLEKTWEGVKRYLQEAGAFSGLAAAERGEMENRMRHRLFFYFTGSALGAYQVILFFLGRYVRRRAAERIGTVPAPFALLHIRDSYVFILILAILAEIIGTYKDEQMFLYVSRTIFVLAGTTYFLAGISLVAFLLRLRKGAQGKRGWLTFLPFAALLIFLFYPRICAVVGLLDVWFDFRSKLSIPA